MRCLRWTSALLFLVTFVPAHGDIFGRKSKANEAERVQRHVETLRSGGSSGKRSDAAEHLRDYDAGTHPEIVPALIDALQNDPSSGVRREAAQSLGKLSISLPEIAQALENAAEKDDSVSVRLQARTSRLGYRITEWRAPEASSPAAPAPIVTHKPTTPGPVLVPTPASPATTMQQPSSSSSGFLKRFRGGSSAPAIKPLPPPVISKPTESAPLPKPQEPNRLSTDDLPKASAAATEGPILVAPKQGK